MMQKAIKQRDNLTKYIFWFCLTVIFVLGMLHLNITPERLLSSLERGQHILSVMLPPSLDEPRSIGEAALESVQVAIVGTVFGIIFSIILAVFAARNLTPHISVSYLIKAFAGFVRAVPALIWAILFIIAVGLGPVPGIMALAVNSIGMLLKVYAEAIEEIDPGVIEAIRATGGNRFQVVMQGVIPSIMGIFVSWSVFRFDINMRYAAVLGVVGAGGIGFELMRAAKLSDYSQVLGVTFVIFVMIISIEYISRFVKNSFDSATVKASS